MAGQTTYCTLCLEVNHLQPQCALTCLQPSNQGASPGYYSSGSKRRQEFPRNIFMSWNRGSCTYPGQCSYRHVCVMCQLQHKARDYPQVHVTGHWSSRPQSNGMNPCPPTSMPSLQQYKRASIPPVQQSVFFIFVLFLFGLCFICWFCYPLWVRCSCTTKGTIQTALPVELYV